jgi:predicted nucleic acid-binding Zn ribbon protein
MQQITQALPGALAALLRDVPLSDGKVAFAWKTAVGSSVDRASSVKLEGRVLLVDVADQHWAREIVRSSSVILRRLQTLLGSDVLSRIEVRGYFQNRCAKP